LTIRGVLVVFVSVVEEWLPPEDGPVVVVVGWAAGVEPGGESVCEVGGATAAPEAGASVAPVDCPDAGVDTLGSELGLGIAAAAAVVVVVAAVVVVVVGVTSWGETLGGPPDPNAHPSVLPGGGV
jgi:hypothetical protein